VLLGLLSGCGGLGGAALLGVTMGGSEWADRAPEVLCSTKDSIGVGYYFEVNSDNEAAQHNEAMLLISEHCAGEYIETKRMNHGFNWRGVYAICLNADGSPADSQHCEYEEVIGFGQSGTEAENN